MDDRAKHVHHNPLFSPNFRVRCWDAKAETSESNKKTLKNTPKNTPKKTPKKTPKNLEKNASSIEVEGESRSNLSQSSGMTRDSNPGGERPSWRHSIIEDDKEWEGLDELRMKVRRFIEEQQQENREKCGSGNGDTMSHSGSPVIIQAGGLASYHPLYSPSTPRPRFLKYGPSSPESYTHRRRPPDIQRSETDSKAKADADADAGAELEVEKEADQDHNEEELEVIEEYWNKSQSDQDLPSLEDAEQPQRSAEPDDTAVPNPNSLLTHSNDRSTVGFKISRPVIRIRKKMLPLLMFLILTTAAFGIGLLDDNYFGARDLQCQCNHSKPLPLIERENLSQKVKWFFLLWKAMHSEYMDQIKNSTCAFVGRVIDYLYHCPCSSFSCPKSYKGSMIGKNWAKFVRRLMGIFSSFYQDILVSMNSGEDDENQGFCKCQPINISCPVDSGMSKNNAVDIEQGSKDETNQRILDNSFTNPIEEATTYTIDVHHVHPEYNDQYFEHDSFTNPIEEDDSQCTQCSFPEVSEAERVHINPAPVESPPGEGAFSMESCTSEEFSWGSVIVVVAILLMLIAGAKHYLEWRKAQKMVVKNPRQRNNPRQRRQQIEQTVTSPMLGSFVQYPGEHDPSAVRRSQRIRNKSLSPLPAQPTSTSPSSGHSYS